MSIEAMKQALEALENHTAIKHPQQMHYWESAVDALRQAIEQAEMVKKGTKAWADTPDNWVDDLRGGAEPVAWAKFNQGEITHSEMTDGSGCDFDLKAAGFVPLYTAPVHAIEQAEKQEPVDWDLSNSATVERARKVVKLITGRNQNAWSETDRETVHAINALINFAVMQFHRANTAPREWVGLATGEAKEFYESDLNRADLINKIDEFLEEKNT
jgi:hypothetical protein